MVVFPVFQNISSRYTYNLEINSIVYIFKFSWNAREENWYMTIIDSSENIIIAGIKLVVNYWLLKQYKWIYNLFEGNIILRDMNMTPEDKGLTFDNFGIRYQLLFFTLDEMEDLE